MTLLDTIRSYACKRAHYRRTRHEIETMPLEVAIDLDIDRADSYRIARSAVYGG